MYNLYTGLIFAIFISSGTTPSLVHSVSSSHVVREKKIHYV